MKQIKFRYHKTNTEWLKELIYETVFNDDIDHVNTL